MKDASDQTAGPGLCVTGLSRQGLKETFVAVSSLKGEAADGVFRRLRACLKEHRGGEILRESIFGIRNGAAKTRTKGRHAWPVTCLADPSSNGKVTGGVHVHVIEGVKVEPLHADGRVVGTVFEDEFARYCMLGDLRAPDARQSPEEQARVTFGIMEAALLLAGMDFSHVVRTWLFLDRILEWYDRFNVTRTKFFSERGVFDRLVPASTGIGMANSAGTAIVAEVLAIQPKDSRVKIQALPSPLQCPALTYGSSFSRAIEIAMPDHRRVLVSGTASIDPQGRSAFPGDMDAQVDLTMRVVYAILESRGMNWSDVYRAVGYVKDLKDAPAVDRYLAAQGLPPLPLVMAKADVCRDELLFEIEVDAVRAG
jgi:enamine deaminase RidA (YjgF/YER057c/UK114 family)